MEFYISLQIYELIFSVIVVKLIINYAMTYIYRTLTISNFFLYVTDQRQLINKSVSKTIKSVYSHSLFKNKFRQCIRWNFTYLYKYSVSFSE